MLWMKCSILCATICLMTNQIASINNIIKKTAGSGPASAANPLLFDHIFILVMENNGYQQALNSSAWQPIIQNSAWFTGMYAITHPSQPNYIAMIAGSTLNCTDDSYFSTNDTTVIDLLNKAGVSWKDYQENYTSLSTTTGPNCNDAVELANGTYVRKHNPFMSSATLRNNATECEKIVNAAQLAIDLASNQLPQFSFYTPNINNDAHNTDLTYAGNYLQNWLNIYLNNSAFINGTLLIITFDEDENDTDPINHIPALIWGTDYLYSGVTIPGTFNHYSLLKLLEDNWGLGNLGREDVTASSIMDIWQPATNSNNASMQTTSTIGTTVTSKASRSGIVVTTSIIACFLMVMTSMTC